MKKLFLASLSLLMVLVFAGCGEDSKEETVTTDDSALKETIAPVEPEDNEACGFCDMKVYGEDEAMGAFTAQAVTSDGDHVFFDDSGCLLNGQRSENAEYTAFYVRAADTLEWIEKEEAVIVKSDVETPMKYGFSFFRDEQSADSYIKEHSDEHAARSSWEEIDEIAKERFQKKMQNSDATNH